MIGRPSKHETFIAIADVMSRRATCLRRRVGCVLVNQLGHIVATGFNGVARGLSHCNETRKLTSQVNANLVDYQYPHACPGAFSASGTQLDACHAIHAEQNALLQCRDVMTIQACYVTTSPCMHCVKLLMNTGCQAIYYWTTYANAEEAKALWFASGRTIWEQL